MKATQLNWLKNYCQRNLLGEKWLLAPNQRIGIQWKDRLNLAGTQTVNLHIKTLPALVLELVDEKLVSAGRNYASKLTVNLLIRKVLDELLGEGNLKYFSSINSQDELADLVAKSVSDYRLAGLSIDDFDSAAIEEDAKAHDLVKILQSFASEIQKLKLADYADCLRLATDGKQSECLRQQDITIVMPDELELSELESNLIQLLDKQGRIAKPEKATEIEPDYSSFKVRFHRALGEINEVRAAVQRIVRSQTEENPKCRFDQVELLHTDYQTYVPLIHELLTTLVPDETNGIDQLPVTFAEGVACIYSRPGRALRSWLRWLSDGCLQTQLVQIIREGLIRFDDKSIGFSRLAHVLRGMPIGFGRDRYVDKLRESEAYAKKKIEAAQEQREEPDAEPPAVQYDYGLAVIQQLQKCIGAIIEASPSRNDTAEKTLESARRFLQNFARSESKLDEFARQKLTEDIDGLLAAIRLSPGFEPDVWSWLEELPLESRVLASGPMPGRIHVDHIARGGHSGREQVFLFGLDDTRFPKRGGQDPLLLDFERQQLSEYLTTSGDTNTKSVADFFHLIERLPGEINCSCSTFSLSEDRELYPSSALLELYRRTAGDPSASLSDFEDAAGLPCSFFSDDPKNLLAADEWWCAGLLTTHDICDRVPKLHSGFPHLADAQQAKEKRDSREFGEYDGFVPDAGKDLDPTKADYSRVSSSRLETFGSCPRRYFFQYGLRIQPPDELVLDKERWLDPLVYGNLIHELFEEFLAEITKQNRIVSFKSDLPRLLELLQEKIKIFSDDIPIPSQDAYERQVKQLRKTCEIFLRSEEEFCKRTDSVPWVLEASIGLGEEPKNDVDSSEPVELKLGDGRILRVGGRIDRIDKIGSGSNNFSIWDYKSGSDYTFDAANPFQQGRKLQPFLYVGMLRHRLRKAVGKNAKVTFFGYFFPSPRTSGSRIQWKEIQLSQGDEVLRHICDLIASGSFIATNNEEDCKYCDYQSICGDPDRIAENSLIKLDHVANQTIEPFRHLREHVIEDGDETQ